MIQYNNPSSSSAYSAYSARAAAYAAQKAEYAIAVRHGVMLLEGGE